MQNLMGRIRRCAEDYNMICEGDKIAVGVSGGKDSLSLLYLLAALRRRRQVLTILIAAVLTALLLWVAALCVSLYDYHQAYNGWSETSIIEEPSPYGQ